MKIFTWKVVTYTQFFCCCCFCFISIPTKIDTDRFLKNGTRVTMQKQAYTQVPSALNTQVPLLLCTHTHARTLAIKTIITSSYKPRIQSSLSFSHIHLPSSYTLKRSCFYLLGILNIPSDYYYYCYYYYNY